MEKVGFKMVLEPGQKTLSLVSTMEQNGYVLLTGPKKETPSASTFPSGSIFETKRMLGYTLFAPSP